MYHFCYAAHIDEKTFRHAQVSQIGRNEHLLSLLRSFSLLNQNHKEELLIQIGCVYATSPQDALNQMRYGDFAMHTIYPNSEFLTIQDALRRTGY